MRTKFRRVLACTLVVTGLGLAGFQGQPDLSQTAHAASTHSTGVELSALCHSVSQSFARPVPRKAKEPKADPLILTSIRVFNEDISQQAARKLAVSIESTARKYKVDPYLVVALVSQESRFSQNAVSRVGALGLGQLMPETARELGVNPHKAEENLDGCVRYLAQHLRGWSHKGDPVALALASYNAGAGNVRHYGGVPPFEETQHYVKVVKRRYAILRSGRALGSV